MRRIVIVLTLIGFCASVEASVLCARPRRDGSLDSTVKVRAVCRPGEVTLTPDMVGFCCGTATTTTTVVTTTSTPCPTATTLGAPNCQAFGDQCAGICPSGQTCSTETGTCQCTGTILCGVNGQCGGVCSGGGTCLPEPVPPGCPPSGSCACQ
jgi:hypothetical protein